MPRLSDDWKVAEGTGWIDIPGFGQINPRRDDVAGGRRCSTAKLDGGECARAAGGSLTEGPDTWQLEFDEPLLLADRGDRCVEVEISLLEGGRYAVEHRPGQWPTGHAGGW